MEEYLTRADVLRLINDFYEILSSKPDYTFFERKTIEELSLISRKGEHSKSLANERFYRTIFFPNFHIEENKD